MSKRLFQRRGPMAVTSITMEGKVYPLDELRYHAENIAKREAETPAEAGLARTVIALIDQINKMNRNVESLL